MDDFVCDKLNEWGLSNWIDRFKDEFIDTESFYSLEEHDINNLIPKIGPRAKFKKNLKKLKHQQKHEEAAGCDQVLLPANEPTEGGKRQLHHQSMSSTMEPAMKRREEIILSDVKQIMSSVQRKLKNEEKTRFNAFLMKKINDLEKDKKELVGVFGKTGAGKSSLINAIIGEKNLLSCGTVHACTSVMIKVEASMHHSKYEVEVEFITKEEWKDEFWSLFYILKDDVEQQKDEDYNDIVEKLSALYGEEWKNMSPENLLDNRYFREIHEFLNSSKKIFTCESAQELSARIERYTRSNYKVGENRESIKRYWPVVKCVTVRVPDNDLLQHVTLVDLPGNGDCNKSRDKMWKGIVGSCSTVWIVSNIDRVASEKEAWEILENASSLMGNGGECQQIHFICTKSDSMDDLDDHPALAARAFILQRNMEAKASVNSKFRQQVNIKTHFSDECFKVFTVSSKEFLKRKCLTPDDTEIPHLREYLKNLNDCHSETLKYVSGAHGILSLIQGTRCRDVASIKREVYAVLQEKMKLELDKIRKPFEETYAAFEKCLIEGVKESKRSFERCLHSILYPRQIKGGAYHKILRCVVENGGSYKKKNGVTIDINEKLSSYLTNSINGEFKNAFPNEAKCGPFREAINMFSLDTEGLIRKYRDVKLQLIFLKTEEEKIKTKINKIIRKQKKTIYSSLKDTIEENMKECYTKAKEFRGQDTLKNMRQTIEEHVHEAKSTMFDLARDDMLQKLSDLMEQILKDLQETLNESIELSLKIDDSSVPDFSAELDMVEKHYDELKRSSDEDDGCH